MSTYHMKHIFYFSFILSSLAMNAQNVQWANQLIDFSSEYKDKDVPENSTRYAATQVLGFPNTVKYGESVLAWAPKKSLAGKEFVTVSFASPQMVQQVIIGESYNAGAIKEIVLYDTKGKGYQVYENKRPYPVQKFDDLLTYYKTKPIYNVNKLKLVLNTDAIGGMQQIDCIGISSATQPYKPVINVIKYTEPIGLPENLGPSINSAYYDHLPIVSPDGQTLYFARKFAEGNVGKDHKDDIYYATLMPNGKWGKAINIGEPLNTDMHNYVCFVSADNQRLYLANKYKSQEGGVSLSERRKDGSWSKPKALKISNYYNRNEYSAHHLSLDENILLMSVQRDDSYGDLDIYVSFRYADGNWSEPLNLGPTINSVGAEGSIFLAADNKTIYFSTTGKQGFGSYDVYMSKRLDQSWKNWTEPLNLGPQINSSKMDIYYTIPPNGDYIYFSSEESYYGKNDLYRIRLPKEARPEPVDLNKLLSNAPLKSEIPVVNSIDAKLAQLKQQQSNATSLPTNTTYTTSQPLSNKTSASSTIDDYQQKIDALKKQQQEVNSAVSTTTLPTTTVEKTTVINSIQPYSAPKETPKPLTQEEIMAQRLMKNNPVVNPDNDELTRLSNRDMPESINANINQQNTYQREAPQTNAVINEVDVTTYKNNTPNSTLKTSSTEPTFDPYQQKLDALKLEQQQVGQQSTTIYDPYARKPYSPQPVKVYQEDVSSQQYDDYKDKIEALKLAQKNIQPEVKNIPETKLQESNTTQLVETNVPVNLTKSVPSNSTASIPNPVIAKYEEKLRKLKEEMAMVEMKPAVSTTLNTIPESTNSSPEINKEEISINPSEEKLTIEPVINLRTSNPVELEKNNIPDAYSEQRKLDSIELAQQLATKKYADLLDKLGNNKETLEKDITDLKEQRTQFANEKEKLTAANSMLVSEKEKLESDKKKMDDLISQMQQERDRLAEEKLKIEQDKLKLDALKKQQEREVLALKRSIDSLSKIQQLAASNNTQLQESYDLFTVPLEVGAVAQVKNIYFVADAAFLQIPSYPELDKLVDFLKKNKLLKVEIGGHTNGLCDDAFCQQLSTNRAKTCLDYLVKKGINANRLSYKGYGKSKLLKPDKPENALNQRVEIKILSVQ